MASTLRNPRPSNERSNTTKKVQSGNFPAQPAVTIPQNTDYPARFASSRSPQVSKKSTSR